MASIIIMEREIGNQHTMHYNSMFDVDSDAYTKIRYAQRSYGEELGIGDGLLSEFLIWCNEMFDGIVVFYSVAIRPATPKYYMALSNKNDVMVFKLSKWYDMCAKINKL